MFRERNFGDLEGKPVQRSALAAAEAPPNGESKLAVEERAAMAWNWIVEQIDGYLRAENCFIVIVSHGFFLNALFKRICSVYQEPYPGYMVWGNTTYMRFTLNFVRRPILLVEKINESWHLQSIPAQNSLAPSPKCDQSHQTLTKDNFIDATTEKPASSGKFPPLAFRFNWHADSKLFQNEIRDLKETGQL